MSSTILTCPPFTVPYIFSGAFVYNSANESVGNGADQTITWDSSTWDTDSYHSNVTNNSRLTAPVTGKYEVFGGLAFFPNTTGDRYLNFRLNGAAILAYFVQASAKSGGIGTNVGGYYQVALSAGDYVEMRGFQNSGGALTVTMGAQGGSFFGIRRLV